MVIDSSSMGPKGVRGDATQHSKQATNKSPGKNHGHNTEKAGIESSDSLSLTSASKSLQDIEKSLADQPVVDSNRVEELRAAIRDGSYEVNAESIADKILEMEAALDKVR